MKNKIGLIFLAVLVTAVLASCKKKEEDTTKPSIYGLSVVESKPFIRANEEVTFTLDLSNIYTSDGKDPGTLGVYWQVNSEKRDTTTLDALNSNPDYKHTFKEVGSYTIAAYLFTLNDSYYVTSDNTSVEAIDPDTALKYRDLNPDIEVLDGNIYSVYTFDNLKWITRNLYGTESGRDYRDCEVVSALFGRYYTWEEAQHACPEGWRLPTAEEFDNCLGSDSGDLMVNATFLDQEMWTYWPQVLITNEKHFNALPVGYTDIATVQKSFGSKEYAVWWTSDQEDGYGVYRYIFCEEPQVKAGKGSINSLALNVRCVKEI